MRSLLPLPLLLCAATLTSAFQWMLPDPATTTIDISSRNTTLTWDPVGSGDSISTDDLAEVDLWFWVTFYNEEYGSASSTGGWTLAENVSVADGRYVWDAVASVLTPLEATGNAVAGGREHYFEARLHDTNQSTRATLTSPRFAVEGYDRIVGAGPAPVQPLAGMALLAGLFAAGVGHYW